MHLPLRGKVKPDRSGWMRIGELAEQAGVSTKTLRYYDGLGLVRPRARSTSGYRVYDADAAERVSFIKLAQDLGFTLDEIREIVAIRDDGMPPCSRVLDLIQQRVAELDRRLAELSSLKLTLEERARHGAALDPGDCRAAVCAIVQPSPGATDRAPG